MAATLSALTTKLTLYVLDHMSLFGSDYVQTGLGCSNYRLLNAVVNGGISNASSTQKSSFSIVLLKTRQSLKVMNVPAIYAKVTLTLELQC